MAQLWGLLEQEQQQAGEEEEQLQELPSPKQRIKAISGTTARELAHLIISQERITDLHKGSQKLHQKITGKEDS